MIDRATFNRYAHDPAAFRDDLIVDVDGEPRRFADVQDPWQRSDFAALDGALMRCNGRSRRPALTRCWLERGRGCSKTTDLAVTVCWALAFATRPIKGYAFAADLDQAALLKDAVETLLRLNPWLGEILTVQEDSVVNVAHRHPGKGARLEVWTSDVKSSYGILPDLIVCDEVVHWEESAENLWHSLLSSAAKKSTCLLVVITNAGYVTDWQYKVCEIARTDEAWAFRRLDGPAASWITSERLAEQRRMLPPVAFARLWLNQWASGGGDALTPEDIDAAFDPRARPMSGHEAFANARASLPDWQFVAGLDLGLTRDHSAVVVLAVPTSAQPTSTRIRLAHHHRWVPPQGGKINIDQIEQHLLRLDEEFHLVHCCFDPWQAEHLSQRLESLSDRRLRTSRAVTTHIRPFMIEAAPTAKLLRETAAITIESFQDHRLCLYEVEPLRRDLLKLRCEEKKLRPAADLAPRCRGSR